MVSIFVSNFIRYRKEGYEPQRDLILVATCDEEIDGSRFNGINYLLKNRRDLIDAEFALNEVGTGALDRNGKPARLYVQVGEKIYQTYELEVRSPGGHSALPSRDNAIYRLANGLARLAAFDFPFKLTETTRAYFAAMSKVMGAKTAADMQAILHDPPDPAAIARLSVIPQLNAQFRTTCVATMLEAGHAPNALPQRARATINCRGLPGDSAEDVLKTLAGVLADDQIRITRSREPDIAPSPPLTREILEPIERVAAQMWPGIPVIPQQNVSTTDGRFTNNAGIPTYGVDGLFFDANGSGAHGLNERIRVRSLYEGHEFLYRLVKLYGGGA
jgi:acetylornithine deacetylase/succinyl-diaminopimelate desuccinylase-like protein